MWDALFVLHPSLVGKHVVVVGTILFAAHVLLSLTFLGVIVTNFMDSDDFGPEQVEGYRKWRFNIGQDSRYVEQSTLVSLTDRVCHRDASLSSSAFQVLAVRNLDAYLPEEGILLFFSGPAMSLASVCVWFMIISREVNGAWSLLRSAKQLRSTHTSMEWSPDGCRLLGLGPVHATLVIVVTILRVMFALVLLWAGALFIVNEVHMKELLMNCAALEITLALDNLVFQAFVPGSVKGLMENMEPLRFQGSKKGLGKSYIIFSAAVLGMVAVWTLYLQPFQTVLQEVHDVLCANRVNFAVSVDIASVVHVRGTVPFPGIDANVEEAEHRKMIVYHFIHNQSGALLGDITSHPLADAIEFQSQLAQRRSFEDFNGQLSYPADKGSCIFLRGLLSEGALTAAEFSQCFEPSSEQGSALSIAYTLCDEAAFAGYCYDQATRLSVTALCPHSCGCDSPLVRSGMTSFKSESAAAKHRHGCPRALVSNKWNFILGRRKCWDFNLTNWLDYIEDCGSLGTDYYYYYPGDLPMDEDSPGCEGWMHEQHAFLQAWSVLARMSGADPEPYENPEEYVKKFSTYYKKTLFVDLLGRLQEHDEHFHAFVHTLSQYLLRFEPDFYHSPELVGSALEKALAEGSHRQATKLCLDELAPDCEEADMRSLGVFYDVDLLEYGLRKVHACDLPRLFPDWCLLAALGALCPVACHGAEAFLPSKWLSEYPALKYSIDCPGLHDKDPGSPFSTYDYVKRVVHWDSFEGSEASVF
eukprot:TRINITY_DN4812_c0_g1_i2.p1 TRINITY_DN4812_c0_g1~~TRINITY_DN4812_c0_g1_i2.p1  ORF type:complete len:755 (-),score=72.28 TRINITY_DN4812_c0_g1_i2:24-2288(-)